MAARRTKAPSEPTLETPSEVSDTERPPALSDEEQRELSFIEKLTDHMVERGVRRLVLDGIEIELDPSAQYLPANGESADTSEPARAKPPGECVVSSCDKKGGHLRTGYCRDHFQSELRNPRRNP